jgi:hypothetical protein
MTLENLLKIGKLKPHKPTREEVTRLLVAARLNLKDAHVKDISTETRFDAAYRAVMQCAMVALMANGFRPSTNEPGHHATVIQSLPKTVGLPTEQWVVLDQLRRKTNLSTYSGEGISDAEIVSCTRAAENLLGSVEVWLRANRPDLMEPGR